MLFFVLPALGNIVRRLSGQGRQEEANKESQRRQEGRPGQPSKTTTGTPPGPTRASTQTTRPTPQPQPTQASDLPRWLEEAQRRVREAQSSEPARSRPDAPTSGPTQSKPLFDPLPEQATARPTRAQPAQARPAQVRPAQARPVQARPAGSTDRAAKTAPPLRVQRLNEGKRATLGPDKLRFDASTVMNGIAWHQVLSPPLSKRRTRLSQRRP